MKKISLIAICMICIYISWCGSISNKSENSWSINTETFWWSFDIDSWDKYTKLMECIISKVPEAQKEQTQKIYIQTMNERKKLPNDKIKQICDTTVSNLTTMKDTYKSMWCEF